MSPDLFFQVFPPAVLWGLYAFGAIMIAPFAWGWHAPWGLDDDESGPRFDGGYLVMAFTWPVLPVACAAALLAALPFALLTEWAPRRVARWWASDWSVR
jgi:hypothetical protein